MAKSKGIPFSRIFEVAGAMKMAKDRSESSVKVEVLVGAGAPADEISAMKRCFVPETARAHVLVWDLSSRAETAPDADTDLAVVLVGTQPKEAAQIALACARRKCGCIFVVPSALEAPQELPRELVDTVDIVAATGEEAIISKLALALAAQEERILLAAAFSFCRKAAASALVRQSALANMGVGAISFIPGSDLPIMLAEQERLALDLMGVYGKKPGPEAAADLAGVFGAGFAYRAIARTLAGAVPGIGWALKASVAYGGTVLSAWAVEKHLAGDMPEIWSNIQEFVSALAGAQGREAAPERQEQEQPRIVPLAQATLPEAPKDEGDGYITLS